MSADFPTCPYCHHGWHGIQCQRHHESGAPCSCQTAFRGEQQ